jgi:hypothetical protein
MQSSVQTIFLQQQRMVRSPLHNSPLLNNQYLIGMLYGTQPVGNNQRCTVFHQVSQRFLHQLFRLSV